MMHLDPEDRLGAMLAAAVLAVLLLAFFAWSFAGAGTVAELPEHTAKVEPAEPQEHGPISIVSMCDGYAVHCPGMTHDNMLELRKRLVGRADGKGYYCWWVWRNSHKTESGRRWYCGVIRFKRDEPIKVNPCDLYLSELRSCYRD